MSPHCPPLGALPPQADTHTRPPSLSPRTPATGWGAGQRGWGQLLFQVGSDPFPGSGMAAQPTAASLRLSWSCSPCKRPHRLQRCFTPAEDLAHGICKRDGCSCLKRAHPGRGKHTSTEACSLRTGRPFSWACTPRTRTPTRASSALHTPQEIPPARRCLRYGQKNQQTHTQADGVPTKHAKACYPFTAHTDAEGYKSASSYRAPHVFPPNTHKTYTYTLNWSTAIHAN